MNTPQALCARLILPRRQPSGVFNLFRLHVGHAAPYGRWADLPDRCTTCGRTAAEHRRHDFDCVTELDDMNAPSMPIRLQG
jgi:hypothetical protein